MYYQKTGASGQANTVTVDGGTVLSKTITGMEKYTEYDIQVSAFTYAGEGPKSLNVSEITSQDGKTCLVNVRMKHQHVRCAGLTDMHWAKNSQFSYFKYRIYSINRPGRLLNFWTLRVSAYLRGALTKFSPFLASKVCLFCNKTINSNNKTRRCNKARLV